MIRIRVVGIGMGPQQLTREAEAALRESDYVVAARKTATTPDAADPLLEVRRAICAEFSLDLVEVPDPERDRNDPADYPAAVAAWHTARATAYAEVIGARSGSPVFLVWGDPSLYDSTLRVVEQVAALLSEECTWDVLPGISAPQLLAARHRIVLHPVGTPVHVTTARRLRSDIAAGQSNLVVMLGSVPDLSGLGHWSIWWGANLGAPGEALISGTVADVAGLLPGAKQRARTVDGWVMDAYLLRAPEATR